MDTERLAQQAAAGDAGALGELYAEHSPLVLRYIRSRVDGPHLAEDLAGEVWLKVTRAIRRYVARGPDSFVPWVLRIAQRAVIDEYRKDGRRPTLVPERPDAEDDQPGPYETAEQAERVVAVSLAALTLTEAQQECVRLRFYEHLSVAETATAMGTTRGAVRGMTHRALRRMQADMTAPPASEEDGGAAREGRL